MRAITAAGDARELTLLDDPQWPLVLEQIADGDDAVRVIAIVTRR